MSYKFKPKYFGQMYLLKLIDKPFLFRVMGSNSVFKLSMHKSLWPGYSYPGTVVFQKHFLFKKLLGSPLKNVKLGIPFKYVLTPSRKGQVWQSCQASVWAYSFSSN